MNHVDEILVVQDVCASYIDANTKRLNVLNSVNITVKKGEIVALIGPSGCGKTSLLDCIAGLKSTDQGLISIEGNIIKKNAYHASYLMQKNRLLPWRSIINNVRLPLDIKKVSKKISQNKAEILLRDFGLSEFKNYYPAQLSGGMYQKASLAQSFLIDGSIMLLDEPFGSLDALTKRSILQWFLKMWKKHQKTILFVTHDIDEALFLSDRIYVMSVRPGKIVKEYDVSLPGPPKNDISTTTQFISLKKKLLLDLK